MKDDYLLGVSNTQCSEQKYGSMNVCIDYLKLRFDFTFEENREFYSNVLKLCGLNINESDVDCGKNGYEKCYTFGQGIKIFTGGKFTSNVEGEETSLLELKGSSCREFEERNGDWLKLFDLVSNFRPHCTRIDVACDDLSNYITLKELKDKINCHNFTTKTRCLDIINGIVDEDEVSKIRSSKNEGYTATFGGNSSSQLCIYNKKAERIAHGYSVISKSWLRFECRYYHKTAESAFNLVHEALNKNKFSEYASSFLANLIQFKITNKMDERHQYMAENWDKWDNFCKIISGVRPIAQARLEKDICDNYSWFFHTNRKVLIRMFSARPELFDKFLQYTMFCGLGILKNKDVATINLYRKKNNLSEVSHDQIENNVKKMTETDDGDISELVNLSKKYVYENR